MQSGAKIDDLVPEAFALVSEAIHRNCGFKPHRVQLIGAYSLYQGRGVEMRTGEGKTITAIFPAFVRALTGEPVHVMTSNDYLAGRDAETVRPIFNTLGLTVGSINANMTSSSKKVAYNSDVVYGTTANFGFDLLRDNLVKNQEDKVMNGLGFAIIDEADSLLLDQAGTPLILSENDKLSSSEEELIKLAAKFAETLDESDVEVDDKMKVAVLEDSGVEKAEKFFNIDFADPSNKYLYYINKAVSAKFALERETDYIVYGGKIVLIDKNTARPLPTHRFSEGIHQAVEAKENVEIGAESKVLGQITIQNFLKKYKRISGMSGTIKTSEEELKDIYGLDVIQIPTNKPVMRKDDTKVYVHSFEKYEAILKDIIKTHKTGQPILIGTVSIEESEMIKKKLDEIGIDCNILNAKNLKEEANIIANAGRYGSVTIATDMAGRGTDIKLGGNAEVLHQMLTRAGRNYSLEDIKRDTKINRERVLNAGGLKVIGSSLHNLVRVDGQLRGRAGRQGEIGESVFYTSLDDGLFEGKDDLKENLSKEITKYYLSGNDKIKERILQKIEKVQEINESIDYLSRKNMVTYDEENNREYDAFNQLREEVLNIDDISMIISKCIEDMSENVIDYGILASKNEEFKDENYHKFKSVYDRFTPSNASFDKIRRQDRDELVRKLSVKIKNSINSNMIKTNGKDILLKNMDKAFIEHLQSLDLIKRRMPIWARTEENQKRAYEMKAHEMFDCMIEEVKSSVVSELIEKTPKQFSFGKFKDIGKDFE